MPIDPSIALQARPSVQLENPLDLQAKAMTLHDLAGRGQLQQMQIQQAQQEQEQQRTLSDLYRGAINPDGTVNRQAILSGAAEQGLGNRIPGLQKQFAEAEKATADVGHVQAQTSDLQAKVMKQKLDMAGGAISSLLARPQVGHDDVIQTVSGLVQQGVIPQEQGAQMVRQLPGNPGMLRQFLMQKGLEVMDASKRMDLLTPKVDIKDMGGALQSFQTDQLTGQVTPGSQLAQKTITPGEQLSAETQRRGQNMVDARSRESIGAAMTKPFEVTGPDGTPMLVQQDRQGSIQPVAGFGPKSGASKPLNDTQAKALLFGTRMNAADKLLGGLAAQGTTTSVPGTNVGYGVGAVVSALAGDKQQQLNQAKRDFLNAVLRRESGAAIGASEFDSGDKQYFPQPGDGPGVIVQKAQNRQLAIQGILAEVPEGQRNKLNSTMQTPPITVQPDQATVDSIAATDKLLADPSITGDRRQRLMQRKNTLEGKSTPQTSGVPDDIAAILKKHGAK